MVIEPGLIETGFGAAASQGVLERSTNGPDAKQTNGLARTMDRSYGRGLGTYPEVIANVVGDAVKSACPKTRYAA